MNNEFLVYKYSHISIAIQYFAMPDAWICSYLQDHFSHFNTRICLKRYLKCNLATWKQLIKQWDALGGVLTWEFLRRRVFWVTMKQFGSLEVHLMALPCNFKRKCAINTYLIQQSSIFYELFISGWSMERWWEGGHSLILKTEPIYLSFRCVFETDNKVIPFSGAWFSLV